MRSATVGVVVGALVVAAAAGSGVGVLLAEREEPAAEPTSTPSDEGEADGDAHADLAARLPPSVFSSCAPDADREDGAEGPRTTSLSCLTPLAGADELLVTQWVDGPAMTADFTATYGDLPDGKCGDYAGDPASGLRTTWGQDFPMACYVNSNGAAIVLWEYPDLALQVLAVRRDGDASAVFDWWSEQDAGEQPQPAPAG